MFYVVCCSITKTSVFDVQLFSYDEASDFSRRPSLNPDGEPQHSVFLNVQTAIACRH